MQGHRQLHDALQETLRPAELDAQVKHLAGLSRQSHSSLALIAILAPHEQPVPLSEAFIHLAAGPAVGPVM